MADIAPYRNRVTGKVQDLTPGQAALFPEQYDLLREEPKDDLGEDAGSTPISHDEVRPTVAPTKTED